MKRITIGRASDNDIAFDVQSISNHHADVVVSNDSRITCCSKTLTRYRQERLVPFAWANPVSWRNITHYLVLSR